jgi:hypothetical protein
MEYQIRNKQYYLIGKAEPFSGSRLPTNYQVLKHFYYLKDIKDHKTNDEAANYLVGHLINVYQTKGIETMDQFNIKERFLSDKNGLFHKYQNAKKNQYKLNQPESTFEFIQNKDKVYEITLNLDLSKVRKNQLNFKRKIEM